MAGTQAIQRRSAQVLAVFAFAAQAEPAQAEPAQASITQRAAEPGWSVSGRVEEQYRLRHASRRETTPPLGEDPSLALEDLGADDDNDLRLVVTGDARDARDRLSVSTALALWIDVDDPPRRGAPVSLDSIHDDRQAWLDVYSLSTQYRPRSGTLALARAGRQVTEHGRAATFDGGALRLRLDRRRRFEVFGFGGRTVHFYEVDADLFEDWMASLGVVMRPLATLKLELDYRLLKEDTVAVEGLVDHTYGLTAWYQHPDQWLLARAYARGLNDTVLETGGSVHLESTRLAIGTRASIDVQPTTLNELAEQNDPFLFILGPSLPHLRARLDAWKALESAVGTYTLHAGWNGRLLLDGGPTRFNRDSGRAYLQAEATDVGGLPGPFVSTVVEYNYTHSAPGLADDGLFAIGGSAGWERKRRRRRAGRLRLEAGTYYQRFKYDYYRDVDELSEVRTFFGGARYRPLGWLDLRGRYQYERSTDRDVHTVTLTLAQGY